MNEQFLRKSTYIYLIIIVVFAAHPCCTITNYFFNAPFWNSSFSASPNHYYHFLLLCYVIYLLHLLNYCMYWL